VVWFGAVQAQEYPHAKWGLGLRLRARTTDAEIERACDAGAILRTHVMRPTWHFVNARDIRWMLELTGPRVKRAMGPYLRRMELDAATLTRAMAIFEAALGGRVSLTRAELGDALVHGGIPAKGFRLALLAMVAELDGIICSGPRRDAGVVVVDVIPLRRLAPAEREAVAECVSRYGRYLHTSAELSLGTA
jgi:hypothetical protein